MANPVIHRELVAVLRRPRMLVLQCGVVAVFALLVALRWPSDAHVGLAREGLSGARSLEVFRLFGSGLLATMLLVLPVFPATSIVRERKEGTLALLLNTPLGALRIYFGKLAAAMGIAGLILALSLPAAAACYALGGISLSDQVLRLYVILALTSVEFAALGLLVSTYAASADAAARWTYGFVLLISGATIVLHLFFQGTGGYLASLGAFLRCASPIAACMSVFGAGDVGGQGLVSRTDVPARFMQSAVALSALFSIWTITRLNHTLFDRARAAGKISDDRSREMQLFRRVFFIVDPQRRSQGIPPLVNPVMVKEFRCRRFGRLHWLVRLVAVCAMLSLGLTYATTSGTLDWGVETIGGIMVLFQIVLLVLITPAIAAGLISTERESGGWQLLQMTPLSVGRILRGKLLSVLLTLLLVLGATLPGYVVMVYIEPGLRQQVIRVVICLLATAAFTMLASAAVGSLFKRTAAATATAYAVLVAVCAGPLLVWLGRDAPFGRETVERALVFNPVAAAMSVIRTPGFREYNLIPANWWFLAISSAVALVVLVAQTVRVSRPQ